MIVQFVTFESGLSEDEVLVTARDRADQFRAIPDLVQKYYVKLPGPNQYGGIYIWDSKESLGAYRGSELAASIPAAYKVNGAPRVQIFDPMFQLRESAAAG